MTVKMGCRGVPPLSLLPLIHWMATAGDPNNSTVGGKRKAGWLQKVEDEQKEAEQRRQNQASNTLQQL